MLEVSVDVSVLEPDVEVSFDVSVLEPSAEVSFEVSVLEPSTEVSFDVSVLEPSFEVSLVASADSFCCLTTLTEWVWVAAKAGLPATTAPTGTLRVAAAMTRVILRYMGAPW